LTIGVDADLETTPMLTMTPLPPFVAPTELRVPLRRHEAVQLRLEADSISWGGSTVRFDEIQAVSYASRERVFNLVQRGLERRIQLVTDTTTLAIELATGAFGARHESAHSDAYRAIVDTLHVRVEPRLCVELSRAIAIGRPIFIGALRLDQSGLHRGGESLGWERLPDAMFDGDQVVVNAGVCRSGDIDFAIPMREPNAVLLPELVSTCADVFS
jgi:hypothetical protein